MRVDVEYELARLGTAWSESVAHVDVAEVLERTMTTRSGSIDDIVDPPATSHHRTHAEARWRRSGQRWLVTAACTAFVMAAVVALAQRQAGDHEPARTNPATPEPFVGAWMSTDTDGSSQTMNIVPSGTDEYRVVVHDDAATGACAGAAATMTGTARLVTGVTLLIAQPVLTCDDGTVPAVGPPPQAAIADLTFDRDPVADELTDSVGVVWRRPGSTGTGNTASPATSVQPTAVETAAHEAAMGRLIEALNTAAADDARDDTGIRDLFTEDATISPFEGWEQRPINEPGTLGQWILHLRAWRFDGALRECWTDEGNVYCSVRARWPSLLAEADERWQVTLVGDQIETLTVTGIGYRYEATLALSVAELDGWEEWLTKTDPKTAARLIPSVGSAGPVVSRYDPALAAEITASIRSYVEQRPRDEISVTADMVKFGDRLFGFFGNMERADGRTYVIAGRYETEGDIDRFPEEAVLAAFDDAGRELWRTELDGTPMEVVAVAEDVWVLHGSGELSRIDASDGRFIDRVTVADASNAGRSSVFEAFGSVWVYANLDGRPGQLIRVHPDLSTTTIEVPASIVQVDGEYNPAAGAGGIWVPLGRAGVAVVDVETGQVKVISFDDIGHYVRDLAVDGDVVYVASSDQVTSIVDGKVSATVSPGAIGYLGRVEGVFGALSSQGFVVLKADDPMKVEVRQVTSGGWDSREIDGQAWQAVDGRNRNLRQIKFLSVPGVDAG